MKTHQTYPERLKKLASELVSPRRFGDMALQDTVEFTPVVLEFPHGLSLKNPPEHGWDYTPAA